MLFLICSDTISQFNVLVKGQEDEINRLKVPAVYVD